MNPIYKYAGSFPLIALTILISTSLTNASKYRVGRTHENVPGNNFEYKSGASNANANANDKKRHLRGNNLNTITIMQTRKLPCQSNCLEGTFDDQDDTPVEDLFDDQDYDVPSDDDGAVDDDDDNDGDAEEIPNDVDITDQLLYNPALFAEQSNSNKSSNTANDPQSRIESESAPEPEPEPEPEPVSQPEVNTPSEDLNFDMTNYAKNTDTTTNNSESLSSSNGSGTSEQKETKKVTVTEQDTVDDPLDAGDMGLDTDMDDPDVGEETDDVDDDGGEDDPDDAVADMDMDDPDVGEETDDVNDDDGEDDTDDANEGAIDGIALQEMEEENDEVGTDDNKGDNDKNVDDKGDDEKGDDEKNEDNADKGVSAETPSPTKSPRTNAPQRSPTRTPHASPTRTPHGSPTIYPTKSPTPQPTTSPTTMSWGEKIVAEEQEIKDIATNNTADVMAGVIAFFGIVGMLLTAWQLFENPDGLCASCCRLSLKISAFLLKIMCVPCKLCFGRYSGYTGSDPNNRTVFLEKAELYTNDLELT